jgi:hypothetical protein
MAGSGGFLDRNWPAVLVAILGTSARLLWLFEVDTQPQTDFAWYLQRAVDLSQNLGYQTELGPTAYWPPGFPLFLSLFLRLIGPALVVAKVLNAILTLGCALLTVSIVRAVNGGKIVPFIAGLLVALNPGMIAYSGIIASEPLYTFLLLLSIKTTLWAQSYWRFAAGGFLIGLATLVRPQAILSALALTALPAPEQEGLRPNRIKAAILCLLIALLTTSPWMIRTYQTHKKLIFVSANGGDNLWIGHNSQATGTYMTPPGKPDTPANEVENDRSSRELGLASLKSNPGRSISLIPAKLGATFASPSDITYWAFQTNPDQLITPGMDRHRSLFLTARTLSQVSNTTLLILAGLGLLIGSITPAGRRLIAVSLPQMIIVAIVVSLFFGNGRFALPTIPFQVMMAVATFASIRDWVGRDTPPDPNRYGFVTND